MVRIHNITAVALPTAVSLLLAHEDETATAPVMVFRGRLDALAAAPPLDAGRLEEEEAGAAE
eukprot:m.108584 g.108584  ORF g.108584 m.108584 type:complete len:62 (+) comp15871_c2_seq5:2778-2963(+)